MGGSYPFSAIVGQEEMKLALLVATVDPGVGGVLVLGHRGTGKSTAVRGLADLLPLIEVTTGCPYGCVPGPEGGCLHAAPREDGEPVPSTHVPVPVVDLPLGATEDRVVGTLDLEKALATGERAFQPGLLARAHRGFLYVDEVNLLEDHLVDLLLDVAASGENVVEREGISVRHPARFVLLGSGNPEEGDLRPQLLDRFGLAVEVTTPTDLEERMEVVRRRDAYDQDPEDFRRRWSGSEGKVRKRVERAQEALEGVEVPTEVVRRAAELCIHLGTDGLRGELTLVRAARAAAALESRESVEVDDLRAVAPSALRHRLRRDPLDDTGSSARVERGVAEVLGEEG
jgi:magnesium chelatase subunit I